ncbi:MAG: helix-turn-helix transcriptional regulator [Porticoccaceae bacterium]|nr:helix-turn-helix transcriptional regulator [Porticoccaceae bacterium]
MEIIINTALIRELRRQKSWSQEQLASIAGLSLRTVQRIEKEGICSLESSQAIASAFELDAASLQIDTVKELGDRGVRKGRFWGMLGSTAGAICAYSAITYSLISGNITSLQAGVSYGAIGLFCGLTYLAIAVLSDYFRKNRIGYE